MLIRTKNFGEYINSDDIVRLRSKMFKTGDGKTFHSFLAMMRDDTSVEMIGDVDEVAAQTMPIIPAASGYEMLLAWEDEDKEELTFEVMRHPVIAWRVDPYGGLKPVTLENEDEYSGMSSAVKYPDGRVIVLACSVYDSEEAWLKDIYKQEGVRRAKAAVA